MGNRKMTGATRDQADVRRWAQEAPPAVCGIGSPLGAARREGVILMETLLVLPILLMLLGGMFLLGDLVLARIVLQDAGRHETWLTVSTRAYPSTRDALEYAETDHAFHLEKTESTGFMPPDGSGAGGNSWGWGRRGFARGKSELPLWTALVNTQHDVMNGDGDRMEDEFELHGEGSVFAQSFDYHRISEGYASALGYPMDSFRRSNPVIDLEEEAIAGDSKFARPGGPKGRIHGQRTPYSRNPVLMSLSQ